MQLAELSRIIHYQSIFFSHFFQGKERTMKYVMSVFLLLLVTVSSVYALETMFWEKGRMGIMVSPKTINDASRIAEVLEVEFDGHMKIDLTGHLFLSFDIPESAFEAILDHPELAHLTRYIERDRIITVPELPLWTGGETRYVHVSDEGCNGESFDHVPNDTHYSNQWGPACIDAERAWNYEKGNSSIVLSIIDTGVDLSHADLKANIDTSIDRNVINNTDNGNDDMGHGTHCAGIAAAVIDNNLGVAGLAQVTIMAVKALNWLGAGTTSDLVEAIYYSVDTGADVVSMSWGSGSAIKSLEDACAYGYNNGVVMVAASGNNGNQGKMYPAAYNTVISVGALAENCTSRAFFSNYGETLELMAPGAHVYSTMPDHTTFWNMFGIFKKNYDYLDGTSMACPHVAGVASAFLSNKPETSNRQLRKYLQRTADDLGNPNEFGFGRVDMWPFAD
jgi:subtilisin family serine protease